MLKFAVVIGVALWSGPAVAIRWEFDDGTTQGWSAKEAVISGGRREFHQFLGVVEDGVWRIEVDPAVVKGNYGKQSVKPRLFSNLTSSAVAVSGRRRTGQLRRRESCRA